MNNNLEPRFASSAIVTGSYMMPGDRARYWSYYDDEFLSVDLAAELATNRVIAINENLAEYVFEGDRLKSMRPFALYPPALSGGSESPKIVGSTMTGGRTFLLNHSGCEELDWAKSLHLDLTKLGWGRGWLEVRPEIKGAGTLFSRTHIQQKNMNSILSKYPLLAKSYRTACGEEHAPMLMTSQEDFMNRIIGGQSEKNAMQAVITSSVQLGKSKIKFVPVWTAVKQSNIVHDNLKVVSRTLPSTSARSTGVWACEIRFSPGNIRAVYFDKARSDRELATLCARISTCQDELFETLVEMIADAKRYLEVLATTTFLTGNGGYTWIKIGDINEKYGSKKQIEDFRRQRNAWFLAKDEIIVRKLGKFFTDMEGFFGKDVGYFSRSKADLKLHHELFSLVVLRDHLRTCYRFALACELFAGRSVTDHNRRALAKKIRQLIIAEINSSVHLVIHDHPGGVELSIDYPGIGGETITYFYTDQDLAETW